MALPYESSTSGEKALGEIQKILRGLGCNKFGSMVDDSEQTIMVQFEYRGRQCSVKASMRDWIKGQIMAIETGILSFDQAFMGQILLPNGRTVFDHLMKEKALPALEVPKS